MLGLVRRKHREHIGEERSLPEFVEHPFLGLRARDRLIGSGQLFAEARHDAGDIEILEGHSRIGKVDEVPALVAL